MPCGMHSMAALGSSGARYQLVVVAQPLALARVGGDGRRDEPQQHPAAHSTQPTVGTARRTPAGNPFEGNVFQPKLDATASTQRLEEVESAGVPV